MTKKIFKEDSILHTNGYIYLIDEKEGDGFELYGIFYEGTLIVTNDHLFEKEEDVFKISIPNEWEEALSKIPLFRVCEKIAFVKGYQASSKGYTEEDITKAWNLAGEDMQKDWVYGRISFGEILKKLKPNPVPKEIEIEMEEKFSHWSQDLMKVSVYKPTGKPKVDKFGFVKVTNIIWK